MASVKSLGVHEPSGLRHAVRERILPPDPPDSSYVWEIIPDGSGGDDKDVGEDELLITEKCVVWCRGGLFRKSFRFDLENEPITQALITYFPTSEDIQVFAGAAHRDHGGENKRRRDKSPGENAETTLSKALVVFLKTQAHIYFLSGTSHIVHMPFEVESACAAPQGVIVQRKAKMDNLAAASLRFPRVPPNSFVSSQINPAFSQVAASQGTTFSVEGLGKPRKLPLRLSNTLENMWQPPLEGSTSHWPRLLCLTDPLLELGLVVAKSDKPQEVKGRRRSSTRGTFLDPAEEILHIEPLRLSHRRKDEEWKSDVTLAVTANRETNMYTIWRLEYLETEDVFFKRRKKANAAKARRRSSMPADLASGAQTPLPPNFRESLGAPLPVKKTRKSEKTERTLDIALSLDPDKGEETRRQSRRVSSLLARADLSASQDRATFVEPGHGASHVGGRRNESHGSQRARLSGSGLIGTARAPVISNNLNSLVEAPVDNLLDELRAGGDFEGFHSMGLDDHDFDGLTREMQLTKVHSVAMDNTNVRYSLAGKPARMQSKVFVLVGPPSSVDELGRAQVLVGIQDPLDKRLQLLNFHLSEEPASHGQAAGGGTSNGTSEGSKWAVTFGQLRRAQSVVDSCKIFDGAFSMILILSEDKQGQRELSLQAPWSALTTVALPLLYHDNLHSLHYSGRHVRKNEARKRRSAGVGITGTQISALRHATAGGVVDLSARDGKVHRVRIQLLPSDPFVKKVVDVCQAVLPPSSGDKMLAGWWHIMHWLSAKDGELASPEWSALVVLLLVTFLATGQPDRAKMPPPPLVSHASANQWDAMMMFEARNSTVCGPWMRRKTWQWVLDDESLDQHPHDSRSAQREGFLGRHIHLAREYMASGPGVAGAGPAGYLPTAANNSIDARRSAVGTIALALHLFMEEQKLDVLNSEESSPGATDLRALLSQLVRWLRWRTFVGVYELGIQEDPDPKHDLDFALQPPISEPVMFCVFEWIQANLTGHAVPPIATLEDLFAIGTPQSAKSEQRARAWEAITPRILMFKRFFALLKPFSSHVETVVALYNCGFSMKILETLPEAILTPLQDAIYRCQPHPPATWSKELLELVNRTDMSLALEPEKTRRLPISSVLAPTHQAAWDFRVLCQSVDELNNTGFDEGEGTERQAVVRALFKEDRRLNEAQNLLTTHKPRIVKLDPNPKWTESQYLEKQKELVTTVATGTLAIPPGRGLLYYALRFPLLTQKFHIGGFNLTCHVRPGNVTVGVDKSLFTEEKINWAFFHQGVAGGLAISPDAKGIDTSWILYNKPGQELSNRHAGFLLALGLNGHLKSVAKWVAFKYLTPKHTMTSIGLLLGLAASYIGTMDSLITRLLSVHVTRMLPRGAADLNLSHYTQTTGIMGIGLLYCNSQHRRMSEIMMSEIEHIQDEDEEDPLRNEGYRLAAGFALGLINLGKGTDLKGLRDMRLTEKLLTIATATKKVELVHVLDRSAAGAVMAIALIFMKSEDHIVARKIDVPDSLPQFDYVRPDILLLRTVAKNLILWRRIEPTGAWIKNNLPREYQWRHLLSTTTSLHAKDLSFFSILAGLCWAIALRFAGSANPAVRDLLLHYLDQFMRIAGLPPSATGGFDAELARGNARMCMDVLALAAATVTAGTGDLAVLRRLRALHGRDDATTTYGSHMAAHLAAGALFLGCGTATLGTSDRAVAALLMAFYPIFPGAVQDNRSHLQAFRHFWVLAVEARCLVAKDVATGLPVAVPVFVRLREGAASSFAAGTKNEAEGKMTARQRGTTATTSSSATGATAGKTTPETDSASGSDRATNGSGDRLIRRLTTPCLLPPLDDIAALRTDAATAGYWNLELDFMRQPELRDAFRRGGCNLFLSRRPAAREGGTFMATLGALGRAGGALAAEAGGTGSAYRFGAGEGGGADIGGFGLAGGDPAAGAAERGGRDPFEAVFGLPALAELTHAERVLVLDRYGAGGSSGAGGENETAASSVVDARLVLNSGMEGWDRSRLLGLKLLFEWADVRGRAWRSGGDGSENMVSSAPSAPMGKNQTGNVSREKGKSRDATRHRQAAVGGADIASHGQGITTAPEASALHELMMMDEEEDGGWWVRDSAIEMLKGRTWLAGREE